MEVYHSYVSQRETIVVFAYSDSEAFSIFKEYSTKEKIKQECDESNWFRTKYAPKIKPGKAYLSGYQFLTFGEDGGLDPASPFYPVQTRQHFIREALENV